MPETLNRAHMMLTRECAKFKIQIKFLSFPTAPLQCKKNNKTVLSFIHTNSQWSDNKGLNVIFNSHSWGKFPWNRVTREVFFLASLPECCGNVALNVGDRRWDNVQAMLCECCGNVALNVGDWRWDNIQAMLCECCGNIALNVGDWHWDNVQATLCERCLNVSPQHWALTFTQCSDNVAWTLSQCWSPTLYLVGLGPEWQFHSNLNFLQFATSTCKSTLAETHLHTFMR